MWTLAQQRDTKTRHHWGYVKSREGHRLRDFTGDFWETGVKRSLYTKTYHLRKKLLTGGSSKAALQEIEPRLNLTASKCHTRPISTSGSVQPHARRSLVTSIRLGYLLLKNID